MGSNPNKGPDGLMPYSSTKIFSKTTPLSPVDNANPVAVRGSVIESTKPTYRRNKSGASRVVLELLQIIPWETDAGNVGQHAPSAKQQVVASGSHVTGTDNEREQSISESNTGSGTQSIDMQVQVDSAKETVNTDTALPTQLEPKIKPHK